MPIKDWVGLVVGNVDMLHPYFFGKYEYAQ